MIMNDFEITKQNGNIAFEEKAHRYWDVTDPSKKFTSVTTIIEKFGQPFDKEFWSAYKALEKLLSADAWKIEKPSLLKSKKFDKSLLKTGNKIIVGDYKTNKEIKMKSFFDSKTKSSVKMKFPLNNLDDTNYWHYCLQLSTYAWMLQKLNPDFVIEDLVMIHIDHKDKMTIYHLPYLKNEVEKMLAFYKKQVQLDENARKRKRIEY